MSKPNPSFRISNNDDVLKRSCQDLLLGLTSSSLIIVDFDECLVNLHFSRQMSLERNAHLGQKNNKIDGFDAQSLLKLSLAWRGLTYSQIEEIALEICSITNWAIGAKEFLERLTANTQNAVIIASSGVEIGIKTWLNFNNLILPILSTQLTFNDHMLCVGPRLLVTNHGKAILVREARRMSKFQRIIAIGHSKGDMEMLAAADLSIVIRGDKDVETRGHILATNFCDLNSIPHLFS